MSNVVLSRRATAVALALLLALPAPPVHAQTSAQAPLRLPALGESVGDDDLTLARERRVGLEIMAQIRRDPDYAEDPLLLEHLQTIWQPLVASARAQGAIGPDTERVFPFEAFLVRDRSVNAFALPGGYVGVHLGLIALTTAPDEMAAVLAHELTHVTQRHIARGVHQASRASTAGMVAMLLGVLVAARSSSPDAVQAAVATGQAAAMQAQLNFSRDMEREADRLGLAVMTQAGYSPAGMATMFDKLDQANHLNDSGAYPYLRSHPLTPERVGEARQRLTLEGVPTQGPRLTPDPVRQLRHTLMRARARVLGDPSTAALQRQLGQERSAEDHARPWDERLAAACASALAASRLRDGARLDAALRTMTALVAEPPPGVSPAERAEASRLAAHTTVEVELARGHHPAAAAALQSLQADHGRAAMLLRARVASQSPDGSGAAEAAETLELWANGHPADAPAWDALAALQARRGLLPQQLRAEAEAEASRGNLVGAIDRMRAAQQQHRTRAASSPAAFVEASVIDARLRSLLAERRQRELELRAERRGGGARDDDR